MSMVRCASVTVLRIARALVGTTILFEPSRVNVTARTVLQWRPTLWIPREVLRIILRAISTSARETDRSSTGDLPLHASIALTASSSVDGMMLSIKAMGFPYVCGDFLKNNRENLE